MKALGYVRVSTDEQAKDGLSLDAQEQKIRAYCCVKDWQLVGIERDEGESAKSLGRTGMGRLMRAVSLRQVEAVVVCKLDRLTRSVVDLNRLVQLFDVKGVALVSLAESLDATTATGRLMMNLLASVSQWEREVIGERTKAVMQHMKRTGRAYTSARFGYDRRDDRFEKNATETRVTRKMRDWHESGISYSEIARRLDRNGIPTKRGGKWHPDTVRKILLSAEVRGDGEGLHARAGS